MNTIDQLRVKEIYSTVQTSQKLNACCVLHAPHLSKKKTLLLAKVVGLRDFACANSSTVVRILDEPCSYTNHYKLAY